MVSQERAERTRQRLLQAAAAEFSRYGYGGTSLQRVSRAAGVTMGALTFHFPTKLDLAAAVHAHGSAITRTTVARAAAAPPDDGSRPRLGRAVAITRDLVRLLHEEAAVRAAGRLSREQALGQLDWNASWLPQVHELLEQAGREGELRSGVDPSVLALLIRHLVSGLRESVQCGGGGGRSLGELDAVWDVVLRGAVDGDRRPPGARTGP